jgi:hypothetical protein
MPLLLLLISSQGELNGLNITTVIEFDHENDDELEPTEAGPELVVS